MIAPVSFDDEPLILVDVNNQVIGHAPKMQAHLGQGLLHRAFSCFLFDEQGRVFLQKRSAQKFLWPLYWSNSFCSHPRKGETLEQAVCRRMQEELNIQVPVFHVYDFVYHASYLDKGSEHEYCSVYVAQCTSENTLRTHPDEVAESKWMLPSELTNELHEHASVYTPWLHLEWAALTQTYASFISAKILSFSTSI